MVIKHTAILAQGSGESSSQGMQRAQASPWDPGLKIAALYCVFFVYVNLACGLGFASLFFFQDFLMTKDASGKKSAPGTPHKAEGVIKGVISKTSPRASGSAGSQGEESPEKKQKTMDYDEMTSQFKQLAQELSSSVIATIDQHMQSHAQNQNARMERFEQTVMEKISGQDAKYSEIHQKLVEREKNDQELRLRLEKLQEDVEDAKKDEIMPDLSGHRGQPAPRTPEAHWRPRFSARGSPSPSNASAASGGTITEAVNTTACVGIKDETRRSDFEELMKSVISDLMPGTVPLAVYTIYKRATTGYIRFADAATMWQFIMRVKARMPHQHISWVAPGKSATQIRSDRPMNTFLKTLYAANGAPPKEQIEAEYKLGKIWMGRRLIAQGPKADEQLIISDGHLKNACPDLNMPDFVATVTAAVSEARRE